MDRSGRPGSCVAIVQARMGSVRLPGKTLMDIAGKPLLDHVIERVQTSSAVDGIVLATTELAEDDVLQERAVELGVACYRGSVDDVLDRFHGAARWASAEHVVRVTADDPFKDPDVVDAVATAYFADPAVDYACNTLPPTFPDGLDVEVFSSEALATAWREARLRSEREHVTPFIWKHPERFRLANVRDPADHSGLRWTLDHPEDLAFARAVYGHLYQGRVFRMNEVLDLLALHPELAAINTGHEKNEGYTRSLVEDDVRR